MLSIIAHSQSDSCIRNNIYDTQHSSTVAYCYCTILNASKEVNSVTPSTSICLHFGAQWPSGLDRRTGDRVVRTLPGLGSNVAGGTFAIPFTPRCQWQCMLEGTLTAIGPLLCGVYSRGSKISHSHSLGQMHVTCRGLHHGIERDNYKINPAYNTPV